MKRFLLLTIILLYTGAFSTRIIAQVVYNEQLVQKAKNGDAEAQNNLGWCYWAGSGVDQDYEKAVYWYEKAASQDNAMAQYNLAICYGNGYGVAKNIKESVKWFGKSADKGNSEARYQYALYLLNGTYVAKDTLAALAYMEAAFRNCSSSKKQEYGKRKEKIIDIVTKISKESTILNHVALEYLGDFYMDDDDYSMAEKSYKASIEAGDVQSMGKLAFLYYQIDMSSIGSIRVSMSPDTDDDRLDKYINKKAIEAYKRSNTRRSFDNAEYWFNKALNNPHYESNGVDYWYLCNIYAFGVGVERNYQKAYESLEKYLDTGVYNSPEEDSLRLADLYYVSGKRYIDAYKIYKRYLTTEVKKTLNTDEEWIQSWCACGLGRLYYHGRGVTQSYAKAFKYFEEAATLGDPEAMRFLSKCYRFGRGTKVNINAADKWHKKSIENKDTESLKLQELLETDM